MLTRQHPSRRAGSRAAGIARAGRRAFTLTEMLIAISVLLVVIIATSKIFGTASQVTGIGQATASLMQEAVVIERQLRRDISELSREGFFAIRCVAVRNNVHGPAAPLLDPNRPEDDLLRFDQLMFFTNATKSVTTLRQGQGTNARGLATSSRVYYGHGFQMPEGGRVTAGLLAQDVTPAVSMTPWFRNGLPVAMVNTNFNTAANPVYGVAGSGVNLNANQPPARQALLLRQSIALMDDDDNVNSDNSKTVYLGQVQTARSIFFWQAIHPIFGVTHEVRNGRVDAAASTLDEIRDWVLLGPPVASPVQRNWNGPGATGPLAPNGAGTQRQVIYDAIRHYPRAERKAPSMHRIDQALTNSVISSACSSIMVDWTYATNHGRLDINGGPLGGVGEVVDVAGNIAWVFDQASGNTIRAFGVEQPIEDAGEQPWFGMPDVDNPDYPDPQRGTSPYFNWPRPAHTFDPRDIDDQPVEIAPGVYEYLALFGYNSENPFAHDPVNPPPDRFTPALTRPGDPDAYTPWPTAIRVTVVLHDPDGKIENGRQFQFVVDLPRRMPARVMDGT